MRSRRNRSGSCLRWLYFILPAGAGRFRKGERFEARLWILGRNMVVLGCFGSFCNRIFEKVLRLQSHRDVCLNSRLYSCCRYLIVYVLVLYLQVKNPGYSFSISIEGTSASSAISWMMEKKSSNQGQQQGGGFVRGIKAPKKGIRKGEKEIYPRLHVSDNIRHPRITLREN